MLTFQRRSTTHEGGFGLVETIVVVIIVAILLAIVIPSFLGAKRGALANDAKVTARAYQRAVEGFRATSGGRVPAALGSAEWPGPVANGPVRTFEGQQRRFLPRIPERVQGGAIRIAAEPASPSVPVTVTYATPRAAGLPNSYAIRVWVQHGSELRMECELTEVNTAC